MNVVAALSRLLILGIKAEKNDKQAEIGCQDGHPNEPGIPPRNSCAGSSYNYIAPELVPGSDLPGDSPACRCDHVVSAAGNDCSYNYYKEFNVTQNGYVESPPYQVDCRNAVRWRDNKCFKAPRGTEYDWMQFFWNVNTVGANKSSLDDIKDIHLEACDGLCWGKQVSWSLLRGGALDHFGSIQDPRFAQFEQTGDLFGVDEDQC